MTMATSDKAILENIREIRAWIQHWRDDRSFGLPPTLDSLLDAEELASHAIEALRRKMQATVELENE
jgi:hypothetical protein